MIQPSPIAFLIRTILCLGIGCSGSIALAQSDPQPYFRNYTTDNGLPSPEIHDIIQDKQGYIWIATDNGISRFDGYRFKNYGAAEGLRNNVAFHLQEGNAGKIWIQTMSGNIYYYQQDTIFPYRFNHIIQQYHASSRIPNGFILSEEGSTYFSFRDLGILKIDPSGKHCLINRKDPIQSILLDDPRSDNGLYSP